MVQSLRSNSQPLGGMATQQPVPPNLTPADIEALVSQLTPITSKFRKQSSVLTTPLDQISFTALGQSKGARIASVGLGIRLISRHHVVITVANGATAAETFSLSPLFPFNLLQNTSVQINGGAVVFSAGGVATLATMLRPRRAAGVMLNNSGFGPALSPALVTISKGSNITFTNASASTGTLSGIASASVAGSASTNNTITIDFYTIERLALDRDSLLGALPLQNNSTFAQLTRQIVGALSGTRNDLSMPFYSAGADLTFTLTTYTVDTTYEFASVPGDSALYQPMVNNSFQIQEQTALTVASTGAGALVYNIPQNLYLVALHALLVDSAGAVLPFFTGLDNIYIKYNAGSVIPVNMEAHRERAAKFLTYGHDVGLLPGIRGWDGEDTSESIVQTDDMGWIDTYAAATPQFIADVNSGVSTSITYNAVREAVVAGAVQVIGG